MTTTTTVYAGYAIQPVKHSQPYFIDGVYVSDGFVVTPEDNPLINVMPGATWFRTEDAAMQAIDVYEAVDHDPKKFWHLLRAITRKV